MSEQTPLWAAYLEMTLGEGADRARRQWILLPPVPPHVAPEGMRPIEFPAYFYRQQDRRDHKATWRVNHLDLPSKQRALLSSIADAEVRGWVAAPLITCEVHPLDMKKILLQGWKTPYDIINRLTRVAKNKHGYSI